MHLVLLSGEKVDGVPLLAFLFFGHVGLLLRRAENPTHEDIENEIPSGHVAAEEQHRYGYDDRRVREFLVSFHPLFLGIPRPRSLAEFSFDLTCETSNQAPGASKNRDHDNKQHPKGNAHPPSAADIKPFQVFHLQCGARQEGIEPPTGGFGDRCSTN